MLTKTEKSFTVLFIIILILELFFGNSNELLFVHYFTKPALLIVLSIFFWKNSTHLKGKTRNYTLLALVFSLLGDVLLMFVNLSGNFFISGLLAFLLAHVFYVLVFLQKRNTEKKALPFIVIMIAYATGLFLFLKDGLKEMLIPVLIYMLVILTMSTTAFLRQGKVNSKSFNFVFVGAILFMISDSLLALNKFYKPLPLSHISVMLTYALAQLSIVFGILRQR